MIPNILTTVRVAMVPLFAYSMLCLHNQVLGAIIFVLAGITDVIDGYIARHFKMTTNFGMIYDPFADKLMQITAVICLVILDMIPKWLLAIVIAKELTMIVIGGILYLRKIVVRSNWYGKTATVIFYAAVLCIIMWGEDRMPESVKIALIALMIIAMIFAAVCYIVDTIRNYDEKRV